MATLPDMSIQGALGGGLVVTLCARLIPGLVVDALLVLVQMGLDGGPVVASGASKLTDLLVHTLDVPVQGVRRAVALAADLANAFHHRQFVFLLCIYSSFPLFNQSFLLSPRN